MSLQLITKIRGGLELDLVPECFQERFVKMVLDLYESASQEEIPDIVMDIDACSGNFFLVCALADEESDPLAFENRMREVETDEERRDLLEDLFVELDDPACADLRHRFIGDIASVCNFYQLSYTYSYGDPFRPMIRYYELHNYPIVEVW